METRETRRETGDGNGTNHRDVTRQDFIDGRVDREGGLGVETPVPTDTVGETGIVDRVVSPDLE